MKIYPSDKLDSNQANDVDFFNDKTFFCATKSRLRRRCAKNAAFEFVLVTKVLKVIFN